MASVVRVAERDVPAFVRAFAELVQTDPALAESFDHVPLWSVARAAAEAGITSGRVRQLLAAGQIHAIRLDRWYIDGNDMRRWIETRRPGRPRKADQAPRQLSLNMIELDDAGGVGWIHGEGIDGEEAELDAEGTQG